MPFGGRMMLAQDLGTIEPIITVSSPYHMDHAAQSRPASRGLSYAGLGEASQYTGCITEAIETLQVSGEERVKQKLGEMDVAITQEDIEWAKQESAKAIGGASGCIAGQVIGNLICAAGTLGAGTGTLSVLCGMVAGEIGRLVGRLVANTIYNVFKKDPPLSPEAQWLAVRCRGLSGDFERAADGAKHHNFARMQGMYEFLIQLMRLNPHVSQNYRLLDTTTEGLWIKYIDDGNPHNWGGEWSTPEWREYYLAQAAGGGDEQFNRIQENSDVKIPALHYVHYEGDQMNEFTAHLYGIWGGDYINAGQLDVPAEFDFGEKGLYEYQINESYWGPLMNHYMLVADYYFDKVLPYYRDERNATDDPYFYGRLNILRWLEAVHRPQICTLAMIYQRLVTTNAWKYYQVEYDEALTKTSRDLRDERSPLFQTVFIDDIDGPSNGPMCLNKATGKLEPCDLKLADTEKNRRLMQYAQNNVINAGFTPEELSRRFANRERAGAGGGQNPNAHAPIVAGSVSASMLLLAKSFLL